MVEDDRLRRFALVCTWSVRGPESSLSATRFTVVSHSVSKRPGCPAGLFFRARSRSHTTMDPDLEPLTGDRTWADTARKYGSVERGNVIIWLRHIGGKTVTIIGAGCAF